MMYNMFIFLKFEIFSNSHSGAIAEPFRENCSQNREIKIFFKYLKLILFAVTFLFQQYIFCWGKIYGSKIIGGGRPSHLRLLFCKIVWFLRTVGVLFNFLVAFEANQEVTLTMHTNC